MPEIMQKTLYFQHCIEEREYPLRKTSAVAQNVDKRRRFLVFLE